jgi:outer membrane protein assembly factor BamB
MKTHLKIAIFCLLPMFLFACNGNTKAPVAPLYSFHQTLAVQTVWKISTGSGTQKEYLKLQPVLYKDRMYASSYSGQIAAVDVNTGRKLWKMRLKERFTSGIAVDDELIFVGTGNAEVLALSQKDGHLVWRVPVSNEVLATPNAAASSLLLVKSADDQLYAIDKKSGQLVWSYKEDAPQLILRGGQMPQISGNLVIVGFADGQVGVFHIDDGAMLWKHPIAIPQGTSVIDQMVDIDNSLVVSNNVIYVATYQGAISALALTTGETIWEHDISSYAGLAVDADKVYVTAGDSHVWAFNRRTGALVWKQDKLFGRGLTGPAVLGNVIVLGDSKGFVHWLSAKDGRFLARTQVDKYGILATPIVDKNAVYIYSNSGRFVEYNIHALHGLT